MWNRETVNLDVAHREACSGLKYFQAGHPAIPFDGRRGEAREVDRNGNPAGETSDSRNVIGMFVRNENGVYTVRLLANGRQPFGELAKTEARVHQYAGPFGGDQRGVSGTPAG